MWGGGGGGGGVAQVKVSRISSVCPDLGKSFLVVSVTSELSYRWPLSGRLMALQHQTSNPSGPRSNLRLLSTWISALGLFLRFFGP